MYTSFSRISGCSTDTLFVTVSLRNELADRLWRTWNKHKSLLDLVIRHNPNTADPLIVDFRNLYVASFTPLEVDMKLLTPLRYLTSTRTHWVVERETQMKVLNEATSIHLLQGGLQLPSEVNCISNFELLSKDDSVPFQATLRGIVGKVSESKRTSNSIMEEHDYLHVLC